MTSVKKVLTCLNSLTQDAKLETVEKIHLFLSERLEGVSKDALEKLVFEFRDSVSTDPDPFATVKTKTKSKTPRPPTSYNIFIKETMVTLKKEHPELKNTQLMSEAATKWNAHKAELAASTGTVAAEEIGRAHV